MGRSLVASDDFNRASLGANWTNTNPTSGGDMIITASTIVEGNSAKSDANVQVAVWAGSGTFSNDQYASIVVAGLGNISLDYSIGVVVRSSADVDAARDNYQLIVRADSGGSTFTTRLSKTVNGTWTLLHSAAVTWANGDRIELEVEGTTIRAMKNGTALGGSFTQTDSSLSTGKPGIAGSGGSINGDDWEAGDVTPPNAVVTPTGVAATCAVGDVVVETRPPPPYTMTRVTG